VARAVASSNVTINSVLPGTFDTERFRSNVETTAKKKNISYDAAFAERVATIPAQRIGQPDELGTMCAFLCSSQAGYITGQNILIDGGTFPGAF
jgi:3-oxoacyl-[acyl-carrier protein] reductase